MKHDWREADQLAIYNARPKSWLPRTNPFCGRVEDLNQGPAPETTRPRRFPKTEFWYDSPLYNCLGTLK